MTNFSHTLAWATVIVVNINEAWVLYQNYYNNKNAKKLNIEGFGHCVMKHPNVRVPKFIHIAYAVAVCYLIFGPK